MIASVSSAAGERRRGRSANCARSIGSAYSGRVRNCHPSAISTSSTPWSPEANAVRNSSRAACSASFPASGSSVASSSSPSGRDAANNAASSSFARGLTPDHHGGERFGLRDLHRAALGQLEQRNEGGQHLDDAGASSDDVVPAERLVLLQEGENPRRRALDVERPGHHP